MRTCHSEDLPQRVKKVCRTILSDKLRRHIRPLCVTVQEVKHATGASEADIINELDALALADNCRLSININKEIMLLWEER